ANRLAAMTFWSRPGGPWITESAWRGMPLPPCKRQDEGRPAYTRHGPTAQDGSAFGHADILAASMAQASAITFCADALMSPCGTALSRPPSVLMSAVQ